MKKFFAMLKKAPKRTSAIVAMIAAAIIVPAALHAYGPDRATFTYENPAPYVTFDSITDNPNVGDERNFVRIRDDSTNADYNEDVNVVPGHTYSVMVYYHNNAASNLNASGAGIAKNVTLRMQMAADVAGNSSTKVTGFIDSSNANPTEVYDSANLNNTTGDPINLSFVSGSAKVTSNGAVNGATLPDAVFTNGTNLGYDKLDGTLPGCNQYAGYVVFQVKATQPNFSVTKQVRKVGESTWNKTEAVNPGDKIEYLVTYKNTGTETQNNVELTDTLPKGVSYVSGTTYLANSTNPNGFKLDAASDTVTTTGANIGNYGPGGAAYVKFTAQVASNDKLATCGVNTLVNNAKVETDNGSKNDTATVTVNKTCTTPPKPTYTCNSLTSSLVSDTTYKFSGSASAANGATITGYSLDFGDGSTPYTGTSVSGVSHTYPTTGGTYTARLTANVSVNGSNKTVTSDACAVKITVKAPTPPTYTCKSLSATNVSDSTYKFSGSATAANGATITGYTLDFGDKSTPYTGTSVSNVSHTYPTTGGTYTARLTANVSVNGTTKTVTSDACAVKITIKAPAAPCYTCKSLTATKTDDTTYKFNGSATASNGATITGYSLDFGDGSTPFTGTSVSNVSHTYTKDGTYTARLTATVSVNGSNKTVTSDACAVKITIKTTTPPTPTYTCDTLTASLVSDTTYKFSGSATATNGATITGYTLDFGDKSTPFTGSSVADVTHQYAQTGDTYTARLTANVSVNGSNKTVTSDACTVKITVGQPPVTPPTTPETPTELPHTGAGSTAASIIGLGAIVLSLGYYIASRRAAMGR